VTSVIARTSGDEKFSLYELLHSLNCYRLAPITRSRRYPSPRSRALGFGLGPDSVRSAPATEAGPAASCSQHAGDYASLDLHLQTLHDLRRPQAPGLEGGEIGIGQPPLAQGAGENVGGCHRVLHGEIDADAPDGRHRVAVSPMHRARHHPRRPADDDASTKPGACRWSLLGPFVGKPRELGSEPWTQ
jgi:hypothetical protein